MLEARAIAEEWMDAEDLDETTYKAVVHDLAQVNTLTLARRPTLDFITRTVGEAKEFSLLDVGYGDGDMLRSIQNWAERNNKHARLVGVDLNPRSRAAAIEATPAEMKIDWRVGDYTGLAANGWDMIVSSLVAHHMTHAQLIAFLQIHGRRGAARMVHQRSAPSRLRIFGVPIVGDGDALAQNCQA